MILIKHTILIPHKIHMMNKYQQPNLLKDNQKKKRFVSLILCKCLFIPKLKLIKKNQQKPQTVNNTKIAVQVIN